MNYNDSASPSAFTGCVSALVAALLPCYWIGIGGSLIAATLGIAASILITRLLARSAEEARHANECSAQLVGVLDSSQLDGDYDVLEHEEPQAMRRAGIIIVAAALVATLAGAGAVTLATGGRGIHFYLGTWSFPDIPSLFQRIERKVKESDDKEKPEESSNESSSDEGSSSGWSSTSAQEPSQASEPAATQEQPSSPAEQPSESTPAEEPSSSQEPAAETPAQEQPESPQTQTPAGGESEVQTPSSTPSQPQAQTQESATTE